MRVNDVSDLSCWVLILHIGQLVGLERDTEEALEFGTGVFALILFALSLYAWSRRRQPALLIISCAFFLFFFRHLIEMLGDMGEIYEPSGLLRLALIVMDFVTLALFFVAVVVRPKRKRQDRTEPLTEG